MIHMKMNFEAKWNRNDVEETFLGLWDFEDKYRNIFERLFVKVAIFLPFNKFFPFSSLD